MTRDERGTVTVLIVGFFVVIALLVAVVVDASAGYLQRQSLANLADGAALAAADGVKAEQVYVAGLDELPSIDPSVAQRYAAAYVESLGAEAEYNQLSIETWIRDGAVVVRVEATLELPLAPPDWEDQPRVAAQAAAYVEVGN